MPFAVIDIYKLLPKSNCGLCPKKACWPFALAVFGGESDVAVCPNLDPETLERLRAGLGQNTQAGGLETRGEQALRELMKTLAARDMADIARACGGRLTPDGAGFELNFLDGRYVVTTEDVKPVGAAPMTVWIKMLLVIYALRSPGAGESGGWTAFRDLPGASGKTRPYDASTAHLLERFSGRPDELAEAILALGGSAEPHASADRAWRLNVLPRVALLVCYWEGDADFPPRLAVHADSKVFDHLDVEGLIFSVEALVNRLTGKGLEELVP